MKVPSSRLILMLAGFLAAAVGDGLLAVMGSPRGSTGFLGGVAAFSLAQVLWMSAHLREARPDARVFVALAFPLSLFVAVRLWPVLNAAESAAISCYVLIGSLNVAMAWATGRKFYLGGASLLLVSDLMIGGRWLGVPFASKLVGPLYLVSEALMLLSAFCRNEPRRTPPKGSPACVGVATVVTACACFVTAAAVFPGGGYNPCLRMLSALGRASVDSVTYPLSHFLFCAGMFVSAAGVVAISRRRSLSRWGAALNASGLVAIALVPEDVSMLFHNAGCWLATAGGGVLLLVWFHGEPQTRIRWFWTGLLLFSLAAIGTGLVLHAAHVVPFAPWVPTAQKVVILSFAAWMLFLALRRHPL